MAWICLVLFVRIGTFQWVAAEKIKKPFLLSPLGPQVARSSQARLARARSDSGNQNRYSYEFCFCQAISQQLLDSSAPAVPARARARSETRRSGRRSGSQQRSALMRRRRCGDAQQSGEPHASAACLLRIAPRVRDRILARGSPAPSPLAERSTAPRPGPSPESPQKQSPPPTPPREKKPTPAPLIFPQQRRASSALPRLPPPPKSRSTAFAPTSERLSAWRPALQACRLMRLDRIAGRAPAIPHLPGVTRKDRIRLH